MWSSMTHGNSTHLKLQEDCNLVLESAHGVIWQSETSQGWKRGYSCTSTLWRDGHNIAQSVCPTPEMPTLTCIRMRIGNSLPQGKVLISNSGRDRLVATDGTQLVLDVDGNLVLSSPTIGSGQQITWVSNTAHIGHPPYRCFVRGSCYDVVIAGQPSFS